MPNFLKINLNKTGQNFTKLFCPDYDKDLDHDVYWKNKGIDWDYIQANLDKMGYSITKAYTETLQFFLVPYIEDKYDDLIALIADKAEVDDYETLDEASAKVVFDEWINEYLIQQAEIDEKLKQQIIDAKPDAENEVDNPEEDLADLLENLEKSE